MRTTEAGEWFPAAVNTPLDEGDELWVPEDARMEFQLNTGTMVRLDQNSALQILTLERTSSQFYLTEGHAYINHNAPRGNIIQFDTPVASLRSYDRSVFRVDVPDQFTDLSVFTGSVDAEGTDGRTRVNAGRTLTLGEDREAELALIGRPDDWQNWNVQRDKRLATRGDSYRYLPEELRVYSSDLDDNGRWVEVAEYGFVWILRAVAADWAPYRTGRWMWRGGDYVWVSYEPWGWAPHHYGRWAHAPRIGWFWIPPRRGQVYWGPGYVGWVRTRDHVAWVPLAPREVYYGYGNYGPNSVDIRRRNVKEINITKITYKNVQVNNSVTVINNNTFVTGRREAVNVKENLFLTEKINVGRPDIKPERASYAPVEKTIAPAKLPPQQVSKIAVKELKQERRLVKEPSQSVINKSAPAKALVVKTVEQPKTPTEKLQDRKQKGTSAAPGERPRVKAEEKVARPAAPPETKATKDRKSAAPVAQTKPESTVEPRDRKSPRAEEKAATPVKPTEVIERKGASQLGAEQKGKPAAVPAKSSAAKAEIKSGTKTAAETKAAIEEMKAKKELLDSKGKSDATKAEKIEIK
jgi:hypothetical protein